VTNGTISAGVSFLPSSSEQRIMQDIKRGDYNGSNYDRAVLFLILLSMTIGSRNVVLNIIFTFTGAAINHGKLEQAGFTQSACSFYSNVWSFCILYLLLDALS
jgi:hypothetical protein